jgi:MFS family permease
MMAIMTYVPLFIQAVRGGTPLQAGSTTTPMLVAWPIASALSGRLIPRLGFRVLVRAGMTCTAIAGVLLPVLAPYGSSGLRVVMVLFGMGMGFSNTSLVIAVQSSVGWEQRGTATASTMFFRTIGGVVSVGVMGGVMLGALAQSDLPPGVASRLMSREGSASIPQEMQQKLAGLLDQGLGTVFWMIAGLTVTAFVAAMFFPDVPRTKTAPKAEATAVEH